jgi:SAM-dependent methyltransferase
MTEAECLRASERRLRETNRRFYDALWTDARLVEPERFNTWPLVRRLDARGTRRLEVAPGLRPRLPLRGTHFVDQSLPAIRRLRRRGASAVCARITAIPHPDAAFDLVCAFDIIEHVVDDEAALAELSRVAAPRATLLLSVPLHASRWTPFDEAVGHVRRYEPAQLEAQLGAHGFSIEESAGFGMQPKSSRLLDLGLWFLAHRRARAMWWYDRVFMPLGLRFQKALRFEQGLVDAQALDEVLIVCRKRDDGARDRAAVSLSDVRRPTDVDVDRLITNRGGMRA